MGTINLQQENTNLRKVIDIIMECTSMPPLEDFIWEEETETWVCRIIFEFGAELIYYLDVSDYALLKEMLKK